MARPAVLKLEGEMNEFNLNSINIFAKVSRQRDILKRIKYVTDQGEKFICSAGNQDMNYWRRLALECDRSKRNSRTDKATQAREVIVYIPNEFLGFTEDEQKEVLEDLAILVNRWCGTNCFIALHNSHATTDELEGNAHLHILISERPLLHKDEIKVAERNLFFDENNRRQRTKSAITDESGKIREGCYIIPKGETVNIFDSKYYDMSSKQWIKNMKQHLSSWINETFEPDKERVVYTNDSPFIPQQHVGKEYSKDVKERIREDNKRIKKWNRYIREGIISVDEAMFYKELIMLSPEHGRECENVYMGLFHELYPEDFDMPELMATTKRNRKPLTAEELKKRELRRLYRSAQIERNLANALTVYDEKLKHQKLARHYSAEIDRMKKESGYWNISRYKQEFAKDEKELEKLQSMIENTKYWISVYAAQSGETSLAKYRTAKRNLSDLYVAEKALVWQIAKNREILKNDSFEEIRKMDFSKRIDSAQARKHANEETFRDHSKVHEAVFGDGKYSDAQAIVDAYQIQKEYGINDQYELLDAVDYAEKNLVRLKEALFRCEDLEAHYRDKKQCCDDAELYKITKRINDIVEEQNRINNLIVFREAEYLKLRKALYGDNVYMGIQQKEFDKSINYAELFEKHKKQIDYEHKEC